MKGVCCLAKKTVQKGKECATEKQEKCKRIAKKKSPALFFLQGKIEKKEIYKKAKFEHNDKSNGVWHK